MNSYVVGACAIVLCLGCAKADDSAKAADSSGTPPVAVAPDTSTKPPVAAVPDSASAGVAIPKPPSSAAKGPRPSGPSTLTVAVYTDEQADRGKDVYAATCRSCHSPTSHTGQVFADWWQNKPLSDLYNFIAAQMPKNDPGILAPEEVADVVAFLLKMNQMPTGQTELYPDPDSLKKFWIDTKPAK
jgi:mono/diheme cytochrome c family protein